MSKRLAYHPTARIDLGGGRRRAPKVTPTTCQFHKIGFSCTCKGCEARITQRQLDLKAEQTARRLRGRI